jgi:hypothetical protein
LLFSHGAAWKFVATVVTAFTNTIQLGLLYLCYCYLVHVNLEPYICCCSMFVRLQYVLHACVTYNGYCNDVMIIDKAPRQPI